MIKNLNGIFAEFTEAGAPCLVAISTDNQIVQRFIKIIAIALTHVACLASFACANRAQESSIAIMLPAEAPATIVRHPYRPAGRILYVQPSGWARSVIELSMFAPQYMKPLPYLKTDDGRTTSVSAAELDPWKWERVEAERFRFALRPGNGVTADLHGELRAESDRLRIEGEFVNLGDAIIWEEIVVMTLNFRNAPEFADPQLKNTFLFPEGRETPETVSALAATESRHAEPVAGAFQFWIAKPNEPRHKSMVQRVNHAGTRRITIEGEEMLSISGEERMQDLDVSLRVFAKPGQHCRFSATVRFETIGKP